MNSAHADLSPHAEVPSTVTGLWRQRVRWARGLIQTARIHRQQWWRPAEWFRSYLPLNLLGGCVWPLVQLGLLLALPVLAWSWGVADWLGWLIGLGLGAAVAATTLALVLDRGWRDFRYLYMLPLWIPLSVMLSAVTARAWYLELTGRASSWNKLARTGVRTAA